MKKLKFSIIGIVGILVISFNSINAQSKGDKKIITLRSYLEKYVHINTADDKVFADYNTPVEKNAQFKVYDLGNDYIALKGSTDKFFTYNDKGIVVASKLMMTDKEKFKVIKISEDWIALQASNGTYVSLDPKNKNQVIVGKTTIAEWETFNITVIYNPDVKVVDVALTGSVINDKTKKPIVASVEVINTLSGESVSKTTSGADGKFSVKVPSDAKLSVNAKYAKYLPVSQTINTEGKTSVNVVLSLVPIEVGGVVKLNNILFQTGKSTLKAESYDELDRVYQVLVDNAAMEVEISGHTDSEGSDVYNQKLSSDRASSVKSYLVQKGIVATRITAIGYGETKPIASNDTPEGKLTNRRVEFKILKN